MMRKELELSAWEVRMGLLDDLVGQLTGATADRRPESRPAAGGAGMQNVMAALLPVVLSMLASRAQRAPSAGVNAAPSGGLGDILGQVLGGGSGGGLGGLLGQLERAGFGEQARSWVGTGQNLQLPANALEQVFGRDGIAEIARRAGVEERDASAGLAQLMPEVVDKLTPEGKVPDASALLASVDSFVRRLESK